MSWGGGQWRAQGPPSQAPIASNPFAPAPQGGFQQQIQQQGPLNATANPNDPNCPTGPILGKGSELRKVYNMPSNMGHATGIQCMAMIENKVYSGGRDNQLFVWRGEKGPSGQFQLAQDTQPITLENSITALFYEPTSRWLFCGLWSGAIQAFCKEPVMQDKLTGHRRNVSAITVHSSVVVSGSGDSTVRLWTMNSQVGRFESCSQLTNPSGPVTSVKVFQGSLWAGAQNGITCFDLTTLQPKGTIQSVNPVQDMLEFNGYMVVAFKNGEVKIYDQAGGETFSQPPRGDHTTNTAVELMMHPTANKAMLLCGQEFGYVTAYDLPEFRARGSFCSKQNSHIRAIVDAKVDGMFLTGGAHGDITVWQWGAGGAAGSGNTPQMAPNPFMQGAPSLAVGGMQPGMQGGVMGAGLGNDSMMG